MYRVWGHPACALRVSPFGIPGWTIGPQTWGPQT